MTNPVTRRPIRVGEVPSSNLGASIMPLRLRHQKVLFSRGFVVRMASGGVPG